MALVQITAWSLQSPDATVWVPTVSTRGMLTWTSGGAIVTPTPPVFQSAVDATVWIPSMSNTGIVTLTSGTSVIGQRWATLLDANNLQWFGCATATGEINFTPQEPLNSIRVTWNANTEPDLAGYRLYGGRSSTSFSFSADVGLVTTIVVLPQLVNDGLWYFAVSAYDTSANESALSSVVSRRVIRTANTLQRRR